MRLLVVAVCTTVVFVVALHFLSSATAELRVLGPQNIEICTTSRVVPQRIARNARGVLGFAQDAVELDPGCETLVEHIKDQIKKGEPEDVIRLAQEAAGHLQRCRRGGSPFRDSFLEGVLRELGTKLPSPKVEIKDEKSALRRVLHVGSEFYDIGGHTRVMRSFVRFDVANRQHSLFTTWDRALPLVLQNVKFRAQYSCRGRSRLSCSEYLRLTAQKYDLVILHVHMNDPVPCVAFGAGYMGPRVGLFDHADHLFWIGTDAIDFRLPFRQAAVLKARQRGLDPSRDFVIPLPAEHVATSRVEARKMLNLGEEDVVVLSIASGYKFDWTLLKIMIPLIEKHVNLRYYAIGPEQWNSLIPARFKSRLVVVRGTTNIHFYRAAGDIHIDSFPFASLTSAEESGLAGLVIMSYFPYGPQNYILGINPLDYMDAKNTSRIVSCHTESSFSSAMAKLVTDRVLLLQLKEETRKYMTNCCSANGWGTKLEGMYTWASKLEPRPNRRRS